MAAPASISTAPQARMTLIAPVYESFFALVIQPKNPYISFAHDLDNKYQRICIGQQEMDDLWDETVTDLHESFQTDVAEELRAPMLQFAYAIKDLSEESVNEYWHDKMKKWNRDDLLKIPTQNLATAMPSVTVTEEDQLLSLLNSSGVNIYDSILADEEAEIENSLWAYDSELDSVSTSEEEDSDDEMPFWRLQEEDVEYVDEHDVSLKEIEESQKRYKEEATSDYEGEDEVEEDEVEEEDEEEEEEEETIVRGVKRSRDAEEEEYLVDPREAKRSTLSVRSRQV